MLYYEGEGDMPNFFQKHVWIIRHTIPITQRPGWNTEHSNSQRRHHCFEETLKGLRPDCNSGHGKLSRRNQAGIKGF